MGDVATVGRLTRVLTVCGACLAFRYGQWDVGRDTTAHLNRVQLAKLKTGHREAARHVRIRNTMCKEVTAVRGEQVSLSVLRIPCQEP